MEGNLSSGHVLEVGFRETARSESHSGVCWDAAIGGAIVIAPLHRNQPTRSRKRISDALTDARQSEERAHKIASRSLMWLFFALLMGAFSGSYAALIGGRQRDYAKGCLRTDRGD